MFNVRKATQVAAYLIWKRGGTMSYLKLMKLMYLAEKDSLLRNEEFLTGSKLVSMPRGPVLSSVYDLFFGGNEYWDQWINNSGHYNLSLCARDVDENDPLETFDELSLSDQKVLDEIFERYGRMNRWDLVRILNDPEFCPEWKDPMGSSLPIRMESMFLKNGKTTDETKQILRKLEEVDDLARVTAKLL